MSEITKSLRHRINVSRLASGKFTFECTVEVATSGTVSEQSDMNADRIDALLLGDALVEELEKRYPVEVKESK